MHGMELNQEFDDAFLQSFLQPTDDFLSGMSQPEFELHPAPNQLAMVASPGMLEPAHNLQFPMLPAVPPSRPKQPSRKRKQKVSSLSLVPAVHPCSSSLNSWRQCYKGVIMFELCPEHDDLPVCIQVPCNS